MVEPRVPYLSELAMPYSRDFADRVRQNPRRVLAALQSALHRADRSRNRQAESRALTKIGHLYYLTGRFRQAEGAYEDVLKRTRGYADRHWKAISLMSLGSLNTAWGRYGTAQEMNAEALSLFAAAGTAPETQMVLNNLGVLEKYRGKYESALSAYRQALETDVRPGRLRVLILKNIARFYGYWGESEEAMVHYERSVQAAKNLSDLRGQGEVLVELARACSRMTGNKQQALEYAGRSLDALKQARVPTAPVMKLMGDLHMDAGNLDRAEPYVREAGYGSSLGRYCLLKSNPRTARQHFQSVVKAAQEDENLDELFAAHTGLGRVSEALKDYRKAEHYYAKALEITEALRESLIPSMRKNFYAVSINGFSRSEPAKGLIRVTLMQGRPERSIYPGETVRARAFADNLAIRVEAGYFGVPNHVLEQEADLANQLASVITARGVLPKDADKARFTELTLEIRRLKRRREDFLKKLRQRYPDYADVKYPKPLHLSETSLHSNEYVLVLDLVGEGVAVRLLNKRKVLKAFLSKWEPGVLEENVRAFRRPFEAFRLRDFNVDLARKLRRKLLGDLSALVPQESSVTIIADGFLALLPFEALIQNGGGQWAENDIGPYPKQVTYVGDLYRISYGQSLTAMSLTRKQVRRTPPGKRMLVMADPVFEMNDPRARGLGPETTVAAGEENRFARVKAILGSRSGTSRRMARLNATWDLARKLKNSYGASCDIYSGLKCTKSMLLEKLAGKLDRYKSIVMATHGFLANEVPGFMEPIMALTLVPPGTDGLLTMSDVAGTKLNADVAALTACQTGVGMILAGEGIMSMGRAFQCAGAKSVIMSLWSVAEEPSVRLMEEFFKVCDQGKTRLEAWTEARNRIRKAGFEHPFFWAGFILIGEPEK